MPIPEAHTLRSFLLAFAYSNLWISLTALGFVRVTQVVLGLPYEPLSGLLAFATMFMVYTFAKAVHFDPEADKVNDPERTRFLLRWRKLLVSSALFFYGVALWLSWSRGLTWLCLMPFGVALLYDLKWLPRHWRYRRLKDIPGVKSLVVAITWALVTVFFPLLLAPGCSVHPAGLGLLLFWNTLLWFVNTVFFDLGDMQGDALEGTRTLPLVLGFSRTRRMLLALTLLAAAVLEFARWQGWLPPVVAWANLISLYTASFVWAAREGEDLGFLCDVVADGVGIFGGILLALVAL